MEQEKILSPTSAELPASRAVYRRILDLLVVFCVVTKAILVGVLLLGVHGASVAPLAGGAVVAMFLLAYFYARWLLPMLSRMQSLAVLLLKELSVVVFLGLVIGLIALLRWATS